MHSRVLRSLFSLALVAGLSAVPVATVMACDCARTELPDAVRDADLAIVGTLVGREDSPPAGTDALPAEYTWTWQVERSRDPIDAVQVSVTAWEDNGANCGVMFGADERWLVLGYLEDGRMLTNGCVRNQRIDGSDLEGEAMIDSLLPVAVESQSSTGGELPVPPPVIVAAAAAVLIGLIGAVAFRRGPTDSG